MAVAFTLPRRLAGASLALLIGAVASPALAQRAAPVERNLPPEITGQGGLVIRPQDLSGSPDDRPLGVQISGIGLIGPTESLPPRPAAGINIGAIGEIERPALEKALAPFLGQPLSRKRLSDIQASIARVYRAAGYPFVSVVVPPQEVTGGVVVLRVVEFRTSAVRVSGATAGSEADLIARLRVAPGQRISARALEEDLAWLNRFPYRTVNGVFTPGDDLGLSTLTLEVTPTKPWQIFAGASNTGTHSTGFDRYYTGFGAALPGLAESFLSYQVTGSGDFWTDPGAVGSGATQPNYYSQAARLVISTGARQSLEIVPNYVATRQNLDGTTFAFDNTTLEIPVYYRTAISNLLPGVFAGDLILGATGKTVSRDSYFAGENIGGASADVFEVILGWAVTRTDTTGSTSLDLRLVANPGGVLDGNNSADWVTYSAGRVTDLTYVYGTGEISRITRLPKGYSWVSNVAGVMATQPLPDTEQLSLGGLYATRGYTLDDATVDTGIIWRNELRTPTFGLLSAMDAAAVVDQVSPFAFFDLSWGRLYGYDGLLGEVADEDFSLAGVGIGVDYTLNRNLTATLVAGAALTDGIYTQAGDITVQARLFISF
jgi:hemolysin activation/secretion protein